MWLRWLVSAILGVVLAVPCAWGQDNTQFFPIDQIRPGLKGVGRTVFEGDKISEFQVEILGVLKNAIAPKQDLILGRLSGGPLANTGVIAGMSGSPVYIDGKLVGAVALAFPFSKEPIAGITPIAQMVRVVPGPARQMAADSAGPAASRSSAASNGAFRIVRTNGASPDAARLIPVDDQGAAAEGVAPWARWLSLASVPSPGDVSPVSLALPLRFGGFSSELIQSYAPVFRSMGFEPMAGGILSGSAPEETASGREAAKPSVEAGTDDVEPGSMVSLFLVRGDLNLNADCTVTYRHANDLYACGHRLLLAGPAEIPFGRARVLTLVPSLASSFKLDVPGAPVGSIRQDRFSAIYGVVGDKAALMPVHVHLDSTLNTQTDYNFELVQDDFLSPFLLNLAVISTLASTERMVGPSTLDVQGKIRLSSGDTVDIDDVVSGEINTATLAGFAVSSPLSYVLGSGFPDVRVKGIDVSVVSLNEMRQATVEQVWSTKSEVRPGDHIEVTAILRTPGGESVTEKIPVTIPDSVTDKNLSLVVGSGQTINTLENRLSPLSTPPRDVHQLVRALNRMRRNNRVYALLMAPQRSFVIQGDEYPSPPPSLVQTLLADPAALSGVISSGTSVVGDFETKPSPFTIRGEKTLVLRVVGAGS